MKTLFWGFIFMTSTSLWAAPCQTISKAEKYHLQKCGNLKILTLSGSPVERARIHGELMRKKEISHESMEYFSERIFHEVAESNFIVSGLFKSIYNRWVERFYKKTSKDLMEEVRVFSEAAGLDLLKVKRALALPDTAAFLPYMPMRGFIKTFVTFGCTSVARKTNEGFIYGRNLDFSSTTIYDKYPLVTVQIPAQGSDELKHVTFGTDGYHYGGITGVNEKGIAFAVHQVNTKDSEDFGTPMVFIGELVLRKAKSIPEALAIIEAHRPGPKWVFVISDLNRGEMVSAESSFTAVNVRKMEGGTFAQTNHLITSPKESEISSFGFIENSKYRFQKITEMADVLSQASASDIAKILSYQKNPMGELAPSEDVIKGETIQTIIFEHKNAETSLFVSMDEAPVSSGRFVELKLNQLWSLSQVEGPIHDLTKTSPEVRQRQRNLALGSFYLDMGKYQQAAELFREHTSLDADVIRLVSLYNLEKYKEALAMIQNLKTKYDIYSNQRTQAIAWVELLSQKMAGQSDNAKKSAKKLLAGKIFDPDLQRISQLIADGKSLDSYDEYLKYSFFIGYVTNQIFQ